MKQRGFTLIEMMIVVAILGILASIIAPVVSQFNFNFGNSMFTITEIVILTLVLATLVVAFAYMLHKRTIKSTNNKIKQAQDRRMGTQKTKRPAQTQTVGNNSVGIQSGGDIRYTSSSSLTDDLVTVMVLNHALSSSSGTVRAQVDYDTNSFTVSEERPSYSSSSDDDSSSRNSSYSSNSSDSSYSSNSSDSSYSSSYSSTSD